METTRKNTMLSLMAAAAAGVAAGMLFAPPEWQRDEEHASAAKQAIRGQG